jgi:hypothetical protein
MGETERHPEQVRLGDREHQRSVGVGYRTASAGDRRPKVDDPFLHVNRAR